MQLEYSEPQNFQTKKRRGGWTPKPFLEKKVMVYGTVKRKHFETVQKAVKELVKKWR